MKDKERKANTPKTKAPEHVVLLKNGKINISGTLKKINELVEGKLSRDDSKAEVKRIDKIVDASEFSEIVQSVEKWGGGVKESMPRNTNKIRAIYSTECIKLGGCSMNISAILDVFPVDIVRYQLARKEFAIVCSEFHKDFFIETILLAIISELLIRVKDHEKKDARINELIKSNPTYTELTMKALSSSPDESEGAIKDLTVDYDKINFYVNILKPVEFETYGLTAEEELDRIGDRVINFQYASLSNLKRLFSILAKAYDNYTAELKGHEEKKVRDEDSNKKKEVIELYLEGVSKKKIADITGVSRSTIRGWIDKHTESGKSLPIVYSTNEGLKVSIPPRKRSSRYKSINKL